MERGCCHACEGTCWVPLIRLATGPRLLEGKVHGFFIDMKPLLPKWL